MLGMNGFDIGRSMEQITFGSHIRHQGFLPNQELDITLIPFIPLLLSIVWFLPNSNIFIHEDKYSERISTAKLIACLIMFFFISQVSTRKYFIRVYIFQILIKVKTYRKKLIIIILSLFISFALLEFLLFSHRLHYSPGAIFSQSMIDTKLDLLKDLPPNKKNNFY